MFGVSQIRARVRGPHGVIALLMNGTAVLHLLHSWICPSGYLILPKIMFIPGYSYHGYTKNTSGCGVESHEWCGGDPHGARQLLPVLAGVSLAS